jgi:hypothetical protein
MKSIEVIIDRMIFEAFIQEKFGVSSNPIIDGMKNIQ